MLFHWILITRFHRSYESSVRLTSNLEACIRLEIILLNKDQANNNHYLFNRMRHGG